MAVCTLCQREATVRPKTAGWVCKVVYKALSDEISESFTTGHQVDSTVASADSVAAWHQVRQMNDIFFSYTSRYLLSFLVDIA